MKYSGLKRAKKPVFAVGLGMVLYLIATNAGAGWLYVLSAVIGAVVVVSAAVPRWNVRGIELSRKAPFVATAGEPFDCTLTVKNTGRLARHLLEIEDRFAGDASHAVVVRVERCAPAEVGYTVENPRRGIYSDGSVVVESGAPFGLFYGRRRARVTSGIVVYPRTFDVAGLLQPAIPDAERGDANEAATLHRGVGGEFWGIREYRPGDPSRLVAWRRSTRSLAAGKLAVLELAQEVQPPLVLALTLDKRAPFEVREMVVSAGASLLLRALKEGREVRAEAGPQRMPFPEEPNPEKILAWCAGLQASWAPEAEGVTVEVRPSLKNVRPTGGSPAGTVVLVSCHEFAGPGPWMTPEEEREYVDEIEGAGRRAVRLGGEVEEPWRLG